jgi:hypothetical protein
MPLGRTGSGGHPGTDRASAAQLASYALDCVLSCETRAGIIDDIHFIDPRRKDGLDVSNHLKWLAELPVTFIYTGVGLAGRGLSAEGREQWQGLLKATERQLVLARARPGMLTGLAGTAGLRGFGRGWQGQPRPRRVRVGALRDPDGTFGERLLRRLARAGSCAPPDAPTGEK